MTVFGAFRLEVCIDKISNGIEILINGSKTLISNDLKIDRTF